MNDNNEIYGGKSIKTNTIRKGSGYGWYKYLPDY